MISRAHKIKLDPSKTQSVMLAKTAGTARYVYNWGLAKWKELYDTDKPCDQYLLARQWTQDRPDWAKETNRCSQTKALMNLGGAFKAFFQGKRRYPVFHSKGCNDGFYVANDKARLYGKKVRLPNIGRIRMRETLRYQDAEIQAYVVSREADGWYVSISCLLPDAEPVENTSTVGVDVGCTNWAVASDGTTCDAPQSLKAYERELKRRQRLLSRKVKGSRNRNKARNKVARAYQKIRRVKLDAMHKFTANITKNHGVVCCETLDVKAMQSGDNRYVRKGVQNGGMAEILRQLEYKARACIRVDKCFPSTLLCSTCGNQKADMLLSERTYHCDFCRTTLDRDMNAALNICKEGLRIYTEGHSESACGDAR